MGGSNIGRVIGLPAGFFAVFLVLPVKAQDSASIGPRLLASAFNAGCEMPRALHLVGTNTNALGTQLKDQLAQNIHPPLPPQPISASPPPQPRGLIFTKCIRNRSKDVREI